jgi:lipopolysaccharide/colanic/teichoic acid biosynthesis glycosyltransferase
MLMVEWGGERSPVHQLSPGVGRSRALTASQDASKRIFDLLAAGLLLVCLLPVLLACALAVRLSGPGPVLYRQRRIGVSGWAFTMHKFRSMNLGAEDQLAVLRGRNETQAPMFKMRHDPRVTPVGRFLRRWGLDELPQLLDVLRGDMSLVGPRPPLPSEIAAYEAWMYQRFRVKPGMTGLWQVSGRHKLPFPEAIHHDLRYIEQWSLGLDLRILVRTVPVVLRSRCEV